MEETTTTTTLATVRIDMQNILKQIITDVPDYGIPVAMIQNGMRQIVERAIELQDPRMIITLYNMGYVNLKQEVLEQIERLISDAS